MTKRTLLSVILVVALAAVALRRLATGPHGCVPECPQCGGRGLVLTPDHDLPANPCPGSAR